MIGYTYIVANGSSCCFFIRIQGGISCGELRDFFTRCTSPRLVAKREQIVFMTSCEFNELAAKPKFVAQSRPALYSYTCIRSSGLPVGSHSIVGWRAQKSGHRIAASPYWITSSGWAPGVKSSLLSRITSAGIKKNQIKGILKVSYRLFLLGNVILTILGNRV